ncbi:MAG: Gfo/Idh/MocA family oxidoreductase [Thermoguttaceae bacterium]|jgi:predicted dehydrogenase
MQEHGPGQARRRGRRDFIKTSTMLLGAAGAAAGTRSLALGAHVGGSDLLRIGLVGCGGRGTGAAVEALTADPNVKLVALADLFQDRLLGSLANLKRNPQVAGKIDVPPERRFVGFEAYKSLMSSGLEVVLLCAPPHFRPAHLKAAVDADLHIFAEKPVAVDAPGVRSVLATCEEAKRKNLSLVSGLCMRCYYGFREMVRRIHDGALGDIHMLQASDFRGSVWMRKREPDWSDMEWQLRNWLYFTWLSGDCIVEQHIHFLDVCAWIMNGQYPLTAIGMGGRQVRTGPEYGHIYDHHFVIYEYASGAKLFSSIRQIGGCANDSCAWAVGSKARAEFHERRGGMNIVTGRDKWVYRGAENNIYQTEHDDMFAGIRKGKPVYNGDYMTKSTMLAIMGRMVTYSGQKITWDQALNSQESLTPPKYEWGPLPVPPVAMPGITRFV